MVSFLFARSLYFSLNLHPLKLLRTCTKNNTLIPSFLALLFRPAVKIWLMANCSCKISKFDVCGECSRWGCDHNDISVAVKISRKRGGVIGSVRKIKGILPLKRSRRNTNSSNQHPHSGIVAMHYAISSYQYYLLNCCSGRIRTGDTNFTKWK